MSGLHCEFEFLVFTSMERAKGHAAKTSYCPVRTTPLNKRMRLVDGYDGHDMQCRSKPNMEPARSHKTAIPSFSSSSKKLTTSQLATIPSVEVDFIFHVCSVFQQSAPTKYNALALFRALEFHRNKQKYNPEPHPERNLCIFVAIIISSKYFESKPYKLDFHTVVETYSLKKSTIFTTKEMAKAEWFCLKALCFNIDFRRESPYFWG
eukprot:CRZ02956.1 hypothetical protein [Spongospora subterranea]